MPPFTVTPSTMHTPSTSSPPSTVEPGGGVPPLGQRNAAASAAGAGTAIIPSASSAKTPTNTMSANDTLTAVLWELFTATLLLSRAPFTFAVVQHHRPTQHLTSFVLGRQNIKSHSYGGQLEAFPRRALVIIPKGFTPGRPQV